MTNLKEVEKLASKFNNDTLKIKNELKRVQSQKCRLLKQKGKKTYKEELTKILQYEQVLKETRNLLEPKEKTTLEYNKEDVEKLDYNKTISALRSIQSKKSNTRWLTTEEGENEEYKNAVRVEKLLLEHKKEIKPIEAGYIRKSDLETIIETIESNELSQERIVELLKKLF